MWLREAVVLMRIDDLQESLEDSETESEEEEDVDFGWKSQTSPLPPEVTLTSAITELEQMVYENRSTGRCFTSRPLKSEQLEGRVPTVAEAYSSIASFSRRAPSFATRRAISKSPR